MTSSGNPTLFDAVQKAKKSSVPNDNIDRAVKRGSGAEAGGVDYQGITYEGYAAGRGRRPHRVPDRQQEPVGHGGPHGHDPQRRVDGRPRSVSYLFSRKGVVVVPKADGADEDTVLMAVLDAGAEEVRDLGDTFEVVSEPGDLVAVRTALQDAGIEYDSAEAGFVPSVQVELDEDTAGKVFRLIDALEDLDDVQNVYANYDVSDEVMEKIDA